MNERIPEGSAVLASDDFPLAYRYWRHRAGWSDHAEMVQLGAPVSFDDSSWRRLRSTLEPLRSEHPITLLDRSSIYFSMIPVGMIGSTLAPGIPTDNYRSFLTQARRVLRPLFPFEITFTDLVFDLDRISLRLPSPDALGSEFVDLFNDWANIHSGVHFDPFGPVVDVAYSEQDGTWQKAYESLKFDGLGRLSATMDFAETAGVRLSPSGYVRRRIDLVSPPSSSGEQDLPTTGSGAPESKEISEPAQREPTRDAYSEVTFPVFQASSDFTFSIDSEGDEQHALVDFLSQLSDELSSEYRRIEQRVKSDPGTAGDEGEGNWQDLLSRWLPPDFPIETKGRIISRDGRLSPQVDVIVLHPTYPRALLKKKLYMADGVVAAFECKLTLRARHFPDIEASAKKIRQLVSGRIGEVEKQAYSPIIFGVLAHSSEWSDAAAALGRFLGSYLGRQDHPREGVDICCIADATAWSYEIMDMTSKPVNGEEVGRPDDATRFLYRLQKRGGVHAEYLHWILKDSPIDLRVLPLYALLRKLWLRLSAEHDACERFANYLMGVKAPGLQGTSAVARTWPIDILAPGHARRQGVHKDENGLWS